MTKLLSEKVVEQVKHMLDGMLDNPVKLRLFSKVNTTGEQNNCTEAEQLLTELSEIEDKIQVIIHKDEKELRDGYGIELLPAIVIEDENSSYTGVRYYGLPSGREFRTLMEDIADVSAGDVIFDPALAEKVKMIDKEVEIKVFVTPNCTYCPRAVRIAHQLAVINPHIKAVCIEATEFPEYTQKYNVYGVPKVIINEKVQFEGLVPETVFINYIMDAIK